MYTMCATAGYTPKQHGELWHKNTRAATRDPDINTRTTVSIPRDYHVQLNMSPMSPTWSTCGLFCAIAWPGAGVADIWRGVIDGSE